VEEHPNKTTRWLLDNFPEDVQHRCKMQATAERIHLKQFVIRALENELSQLLMLDSKQMQTDKTQFDTVLSRMLQSPPKKESEIKAKKAQAKRPKPSRQR
jgi:signal recognition particle GTPase